MERVSFTIVGVTPPDFTGVEPGRAFDVAVPLGTEPLIRGRDTALDRRSTWWLQMVARLKPAQSLEAAQAGLRGVQPQIREATLPPNYRPGERGPVSRGRLHLEAGGNRSFGTEGSLPAAARYDPDRRLPGAADRVRQHRQPAARARGGAASRAQRPPGPRRVALAARKTTADESLLLSGAGAAVGLLFALWGSQVLVGQLSTTGTVFLNLSLDWRVLAFTLTVAALTAVLFGTAPALRAAGSSRTRA